MFCIFCQNKDSEVIETRVADEGTTIRRRRQCPKCKRRFTTYERVEELPILVIKRDGRRERFDKDKLRRGVLKACEKTKVAANDIEEIITDIEGELKQQEATEVESKIIGNLVARHLKKIDKIAYIRFASVFRRFVDLEDFERELKKL
jgi:transcriptional repressor NrdR